MNQDDRNNKIESLADASIEGLAVRAWNFIHQHRPELERQLEQKPTKQVHQNDNKPHKGHVVDPEHDRRLSENKKKDEAREKREEEEAKAADERENKAYKRRVQERLQQLEDIDKQVRSAAIDLTKLKKPSYMPSAIDLTKPLTPPQSPEEKAKGYSVEESALRNHPKHGPMVQRLLGPQPATPDKMKGVYKSLSLAQQNAKTVEESNDLQRTLSITAQLLIQLGVMKK